MNKSTKNTLSIVVVSILAIVSVLLVRQYQTNTLKGELTDFAVADTASIDKIILTDKDTNHLQITRVGNNKWMLNNGYEARIDMVQTLLETIKKLRIKAPVGRAAFNNVIRQMASKSTKVEIYQKGELIKVYYVGGATQDNLGTYMMLENSSAPFMIDIAGFEGYLYTRYAARAEIWRSPALYRLRPNDITSVKLEYKDEPLQNYEIINRNNVIELINNSGTKVPAFDTLKVREYLTRFINVNVEAFVTTMDKDKRDSTLNSQPREIFTIKTTDGKTFQLKTFAKRVLNEEYDINGKLKLIDVDRFYAIINNDRKNLLLLQNYVFDNIFKPIDFFAPAASEFVKK